MVAPRRPGGPLRAKMVRDLKAGWKSFLAILLISMLSTALFMGLDATWRGMRVSVQRQSALGNLAELWVDGEISDSDARQIADLPGVKAVQRRVVAEGEAKELDGKPKIKLLMSDGTPEVNRPVALEGQGMTSGAKNECVLQQRFAKAHSLGVGDVLTVSADGRKLDLTITGLGVMPEFVMVQRGNELITPAGSYGYACVSPGTLGFLRYSEITLTLDPGADAAAVRQAVRGVVDENKTTVTLRKDKSAVKGTLEQISQLRLLGLIVPLLFFLVAALITWTTMGRLVENQRTQIGALFALGYTRSTLISHYAEYGATIALLGAALGVAGAMFGLAPLLLWFLQSIYIMPGAAPSLSWWTLATVALGLVLITGGAGVLSARHALAQTPASLLRPRSPAKAKKVFLERIPFLWNRLGFSGKMIARNMLRSRVRLFMGLVGTIGCTALMLIGFGLRDTVDYAKGNYYANVLRYDARATLTSDAPQGYGDAVALRAGATDAEEEMITALDVFLGGDWKTKQVFVLENGQKMIRLQDESGNPLELPSDGVAVTRKLAEDEGIRMGDAFRLHTQGMRDVVTRVAQIVDIEMDQGLYVSREAWRRLGLLPWAPTAVLMKGDSLDLERAQDMDGVDKVQTRQEENEDGNALLRTLNLVVLLLIGFSGGLALVVYYNLGQLNYSERIRELATLKVLGFTPGEMKKLVLRENILITCFGLPFGFAVGVPLHRLVMQSALPSAIQFVQHIEPLSVVLITLITIGFSWIVNWALGSKFKSIDMVEALKSAE